MKPTSIIALSLAALVAPVAAHAAETQTISPTERLDFNRPEAWGMKYFTSVTLLTGLGPPRALRPLQVRPVLELGWVPEVSDLQRTVGFNGTKQEDLNKLPVFGRLRVSIGLPWRLSLTLAWVPPIRINGVQADLFTMALGRPFRFSRDLTLGAQGYGQVGNTTGAFTCTNEEAHAGTNAEKNPFNCLEPSHDEIKMNYVGLELSASYRIRPARGLEPYAGVSVNYLILEFDVDARYGGTIDHTVLKTEGSTFALTGGLLFPVTRRLDIGAEVFYSPLSVRRPQNDHTTVEGLTNVRGMIAYRFF